MSKKLPSTRDHGGLYPTVGNIGEPMMQHLERTGFVPMSRLIQAGKGLKGGGYLSYDLTLCADFGDQEGQVTEGNDPRLSDAREWIAELVPEDEAAEGMNDVARKWTSALVRHAITGWWDDSGAKAKLDGIEEGATANSPDDELLNRRNHTGQQPISSIIGLEDALAGMGGGGAGGEGGIIVGGRFSPVKNINQGSKVRYTLELSDIGKTLVFKSLIDHIEIVMPMCYGKIGDEIYFLAPPSLYPNGVENFFSEVLGHKFYPNVAYGLMAGFREGWSVACLKKVTDVTDGMPNWVLFGDLAEAPQ